MKYQLFLVLNIYLPLGFFGVNDGFSLYHQSKEYSPTDQMSKVWRICSVEHRVPCLSSSRDPVFNEEGLSGFAGARLAW